MEKQQTKDINKEKLNTRRLLIVAFLMSITALSVVVSVWVFVNLGESSISKTNKVEITELQGQLLQLAVAVKTQENLTRNNIPIGSTSKSE